MVKLKLTSWCMAGAQGAIVEKSELDAKKLVKQGVAVVIDEPKPKAEKRQKKVKKPAEKK